MARATSSLPVPDSPRMSTVVGVAATRTISSASSFILGFWPRMKSPSACAWISRSIIPYRSSSSSERLRSASRSHMNLALAPPITSAVGGLSVWMARSTSGLPVTSMMRSTVGSATRAPSSVATGTLSRRASSRPGAHGLRSAIPRMVTVGSPTNISRRARPPLPAPMMTTLVMGGGEDRSERLRHLVAFCAVLEGRVLGDEGQVDRPRGTVPLLADDDLGEVLVLRRLHAVPIGPVEKEDEVGVLLESAGLAQVGQLGLLALAALHRARKLGEGHHGHVELLGQGLERARDLGDLLLPVLGVPAPHELEIVDDDEVEAVLGLHASRLGPRLEHGQGGRVVDVDGRLREPARGVGEARPVARVEVTRAHLVRIHAPLRAEETLDELLLGHLEAQDEDATLAPHARVLGDVHGEGGLAHGGPPRNDDEIARLEARGLLVEPGEARGQSGDVLLLVVELLDLLEGALEDGAHGEGGALHAPLGDLEDEPLGVVQHLLDVVAPVVAPADDLGGDPDEVAQDGLLPHDGAVGKEMGGRGRRLGESAERGGTSDLVELAAPAELLGDGEQVHRLVALEEREHGVEDLAVAFLVKVGGLEELDRLGKALPIQEHSPQHRPLRLQAVRRDLGGEEIGERRHVYSRVTETLSCARSRRTRHGPRRGGPATARRP